MPNHSDTWIAAKLLASVGSVKPSEPRFDAIQKPLDMRHFSVDPGGVITGPHGVHVLNDFMGTIGRTLWRKHYAMERESFEPWIDFGGEG